MITMKRSNKWFFDQPRLQKIMSTATIASLNQSGALIRKIAQRSMRYRKRGVSAPAGKPPYAHQETGALLRRDIIYAFDPKTQKVVVGPIGYSGSQAPGIQEHGSGSLVKIVNRRRTHRVVGGSGEIRVDGSTKKSRLIKTYQGSFRVVYATLKTTAQVDRANRLQEKIYGPKVSQVRIKPHPFMIAARKEAKDSGLIKRWKDAL